MNYDFKLQYDHNEILDRAARYLAMPYKNWTTGDEDRLAEEAGWHLVNGPFNLADVRTIVRWKSHRKLSLFDDNDATDVESAITGAIAATPAGDERRAVNSLTRLSGVELKTASAILTAMFPTIYTVCDFRASAALGQRDLSSLRYYLAYLAACRRMAAEYSISLRDFDRANWQWSKELSKSRVRPCRDACTTYTPGVEAAAR